MTVGWYGVRPYLEPRSFPYLRDRVPQLWVAQHSASLTWNDVNAFYTQPGGPTPAAYVLDQFTIYLWTILCVLAAPDIGPKPPDTFGFTGLAHPELAAPP